MKNYEVLFETLLNVCKKNKIELTKEQLIDLLNKLFDKKL